MHIIRIIHLKLFLILIPIISYSQKPENESIGILDAILKKMYGQNDSMNSVEIYLKGVDTDCPVNFILRKKIPDKLYLETQYIYSNTDCYRKLISKMNMNNDSLSYFISHSLGSKEIIICQNGACIKDNYSGRLNLEEQDLKSYLFIDEMLSFPFSFHKDSIEQKYRIRKYANEIFLESRRTSYGFTIFYDEDSLLLRRVDFTILADFSPKQYTIYLRDYKKYNTLLFPSKIVLYTDKVLYFDLDTININYLSDSSFNSINVKNE